MDVGHLHEYDHTTVVTHGRAKILYEYMQDGVRVSGESSEIGHGCAKSYIAIKAEVLHTVKALEDDTQYLCMYSHRDFDGTVVQEYNGNDKASAAKASPELAGAAA